MRRVAICAAAAVCFLGSTGAEASSWRKVMKVDPYTKDSSSAHYYDYASTFQDKNTGWIVTHLQFVEADKAAAGDVPSWYLWAFDCSGKAMHSIGFQSGDGFKTEADWRTKSYPLTGSDSDAVTAELGNQLCAMDGLWPKDEIGK
jgi:hypothetical protein